MEYLVEPPSSLAGAAGSSFVCPATSARAAQICPRKGLSVGTSPAMKESLPAYERSLRRPMTPVQGCRNSTVSSRSSSIFFSGIVTSTPPGPMAR